MDAMVMGTNGLGFIKFHRNNLKELAELDLIAYSKDQIQEVQKELKFLGSVFKKHETLTAFKMRVLKEVHKVMFVINSSDLSPSSFDRILEEIFLLKIEALVIDVMYGSEAQKLANISNYVSLQESNPHLKDGLVGFHEVIDEIIGQVRNIAQKKLDIVSIVGMAGLGQTTLAKRVYEHPALRNNFNFRAWCNVSQEYQNEGLLREILGCIHPENSKLYSKKEEGALALELKQSLLKNKYLIILDDVWDLKAWNTLKVSFPDDENGSRIIITSRMHRVASDVKCYSEPHCLRPFNDNESWELLKKTLFPNDDFPPKLRRVGMQIAKSCGGLPLSVVIIAGILRTIEQDGWEEFAARLSTSVVSGTEQCINMLEPWFKVAIAARNVPHRSRHIGRGLGTETVTTRPSGLDLGRDFEPYLELSYRRIPDCLKKCFLYFGAFVRGQEIPTKRLMWLWIAEGFVQQVEQEESEEVAERCMKDLIDRNLIMVARRRSIGGVKTCRVHDLLREFCAAKAKEKAYPKGGKEETDPKIAKAENFLQLLHGYDGLFTFSESYNTSRFCIYSKQEHFEKSRLFCPQIRCLMFFSHGDRYPTKYCDNLFIFKICKLLTVLDLGEVLLGEHFPTEIEVLVELRYLAIWGKMQSIPSSIANLTNLETFLVKGNSGDDVIMLPENIWSMMNLRHLGVSNCCGDMSLAKDNLDNSWVLCNLSTFSKLALVYEQGVEKLFTKFPNIRRLKCELREPEDSEELGTHCSRVVSMGFLTRLKSLSLSLKFIDHSNPIQFHLPPNLEKLSLSYFPRSMISAIEKLTNLVALKLSNDKEDISDREEELPHENMTDSDHEEEIPEVVEEREQPEEETRRAKRWDVAEEVEFPKLRFLKLSSMTISRWTGSGDHFPGLQRLKLEDCWYLKEMPNCLGSNSPLQMIEIRYCPISVEFLVDEIERQQKYEGNQGLQIFRQQNYEGNQGLEYEGDQGPQIYSFWRCWLGLDSLSTLKSGYMMSKPPRGNNQRTDRIIGFEAAAEKVLELLGGEKLSQGKTKKEWVGASVAGKQSGAKLVEAKDKKEKLSFTEPIGNNLADNHSSSATTAALEIHRRSLASIALEIHSLQSLASTAATPPVRSDFKRNK
ncbi:putative late blight resistance protein homolog R1A-3 [Coffea arabica]|uniref:Late blight resistance protein homolog R1A-3 n=1 Tax=Coffea arabica TaxID=13443 RepID=A0A6P6UKK3_COFAR